MERIDTLEEEPKKKRSPIALLIVVALAMIGGLVWWFATNSEEPEVEHVPGPTVVGQTQEQAIATLKEAGLEFAIASTEASSEIPANSVISSNPEAGTIVDKGTTVKVVLSSGPADTTVPDVSGLTQQQARDQLKQNGLQVSDVVTVDDPSQEKGRVIKTDPEAGAKISEGESVKLFIASGNVSVPADLVGRPRDEVLQALQELGLNTNVETEESADHAEGTVMSLSATGTVSKDTTITVTVAKAPAPTQTPAQEQPQPPEEQPSENGE